MDSRPLVVEQLISRVIQGAFGMGPKTVGIFKAHSQRAITFMVEDLIAELGFQVALPGLLKTVRQRHSLVVANPGNGELEQELLRWEKAVTVAVNRQPRTFEQRISEEDLVRLRGMGIRLDQTVVEQTSAGTLLSTD
jgi:hypothetical protein